jgi:hypothetical protein
MIRTFAALSAVAVFVCAAGAQNPQVAAIQNQIKGLQAEKTLTIKAIEAQYDLMIRREKVEEAVLSRERKILGEQEALLLKLADEPGEKAAIRAQYETLRSYLATGKRLDAADRAVLRTMKKNHVTAVSNAYAARIKYLQASSRAAASSKPKK